MIAANPSCYDADMLISDNGRNGWSGAYLLAKVVLNADHSYIQETSIPDNYSVRIRNLKNIDWGVNSAFPTNIACASGESSSLWAQISTGSNELDALGKLID